MAALLFMMRMSETAGLVAIDSKEEPELRDQLPGGVEVLRFTGPIFFCVAIWSANRLAVSFTRRHSANTWSGDLPPIPSPSCGRAL